MNYKELEQILTSRQIEAVDHILNNRHYDIWVYTVLYQISGKTIKDIGEREIRKDQYLVPQIIRCICPYCGETEDRNLTEVQSLPRYDILLGKLDCRRCGIKTQFDLIAMNSFLDEEKRCRIFTECYIVPYPKHDKSVAPEEVEEDLRQDYREAYLCLDISPRASVALSRYCLQKLIKKTTDIKNDNLNSAINELLNKNIIPSDVSDLLHAIRKIGNYGVHPSEVKNTNLIVEVRYEEAKWLLDIIYRLFDVFYVEPIKKEKRKTEVNEILKSMGKEEI